MLHHLVGNLESQTIQKSGSLIGCRSFVIHYLAFFYHTGTIKAEQAKQGDSIVIAEKVFLHFQTSSKEDSCRIREIQCELLEVPELHIGDAIALSFFGQNSIILNRRVWHGRTLHLWCEADKVLLERLATLGKKIENAGERYELSAQKFA